MLVRLGTLFEIEIVEAEWDSLKPNAQEDYLAQLDFIHGLATDIMLETTEITLALYARYPDDYSYHYPQELLKLKRPELNRISTRIDIDGVEVTTNCNKAIKTLNDIIFYYQKILDQANVLAISCGSYTTHYVVPHALQYFRPRVFTGMVYIWERIMMCSNTGVTCNNALSISGEIIRSTSGIYMTTIRDELQAALWYGFGGDPVRFFNNGFGYDIFGCINENQSTGGGGGGNSNVKPEDINPTPQNVAPISTKMFNPTTSNLTLEQWQHLEKLIDKLREDCLNKYIMDKLNQLTLNVSSDNNPSVNGSFSPDRGLVTLYNFDGSGNMTTLLHELFHASQDNHYGGIGKFHNKYGHTNIEFEVYLFVNMYEVRNCGQIIAGTLSGSENKEYYNNDIRAMSPYNSYNTTDIRWLDVLYYRYSPNFASCHGAATTDRLDPYMKFNYINYITTNSGC